MDNDSYEKFITFNTNLNGRIKIGSPYMWFYQKGI
jgi:hypothetical protein